MRARPGVEQHGGAALPAAAPRGAPSARRRRAVERQCTRRRSSPWRYSRVADVVLAAAGDRAADGSRRAGPHRRRAGPPAAACTARHHGERVDGGEGAGQLAQPERVGQPQPQRAERVAAARRRSAPGSAPSRRWPRLDPVHARTAAGRRGRTAPRSSSSSSPVRQPGRRCPAPAAPAGLAGRHPGRGSTRARAGQPVAGPGSTTAARPAAARAAGPPTRSRSRWPRTTRTARGGARRRAGTSGRGWSARTAPVRTPAPDRVAADRPGRGPPGVGHRHRRASDVGDDLLGGAPADLRLRGRQQPVREHRQRRAPGRRPAARSRGRQRGLRLGGAQQVQRGARRGAEPEVGGVAGGA